MESKAQEPGPVEHLERLSQALCECAAHVEAGSMEKAVLLLERVAELADAAGDGPLQRLAAPMADCLARRLLRPVPGISGALIDPPAYLDRRRVRAARRSLFDLSPFPKVAVAVGNRAVVETMENEKNVHVIDFAGPAAQPRQWVQLLRDFRRRPEGPPRLRLTVVHDDKELLARASELLVDEADDLEMAFQFHGIARRLEALDFNDLHRVLGLRPGEARAMLCTLQLHRLLAVADDDAVGGSGAAHHFNQTASIARLQLMASSSLVPPSSGSGSVSFEDDSYSSPATPLSFVSPPASTPALQTPRPLASFLSAALALAPKIVVVTEQDASHNGVSFRKRFAEALHHYAAVHDALDAAAAAAAARHHRRPAGAELAEVERAVLGEEIRDVLLREGARRRERHDRLAQWAARMELAGFRGVPLSYAAIRRGDDAARRSGLSECDNREHRGCLLLRWSSWPLYSVSAWRPGRGEADMSSEYFSATSELVTPAQHNVDESMP
ncbi:hypothetical protein ACP4OV_003255 [Aristida adscensionis]